MSSSKRNISDNKVQETSLENSQEELEPQIYVEELNQDAEQLLVNKFRMSNNGTSFTLYLAHKDTYMDVVEDIYSFTIPRISFQIYFVGGAKQIYQALNEEIETKPNVYELSEKELRNAQIHSDFANFCGFAVDPILGGEFTVGSIRPTEMVLLREYREVGTERSKKLGFENLIHCMMVDDVMASFCDALIKLKEA